MAGTTTSSGLNNLLADTNQVQTTLPSWMDTAQQNVINQAGTASAAAPAFGNTTAQTAVNNLQGPNNAFTQGQTNLNTIASGAANPWITDPTTGAVTPNTNTAMGGLFSAQDTQLKQLMPQYTAGTDAASIGSGNFGSLRGDTAYNTAVGNAQAALTAQQDTAAIQNQQTGAQAASGLGTLGTAQNTADLTTGAAQMNAPYQNATNYANLVNSVNAPATVNTQNQMSPLSMIGSLSSLPTAGTSLLNSIFGTAANGVAGTSGYQAATTGLLGALQNAFGSNPAASTSGGSVMNAVSATPDNSASQPVQTTDPNAAGYLDPTLNQQYPQGSM